MRLLPLLALLALAAPASALPLGAPAPGGAIDPVGPVYPYHTWETLTVELQQLVADHADIARLHSAGKSVLGFDLWVVEIADFTHDDKVPLAQREVVRLDGGTHANEQDGMMLAWLWIRFLLGEYENNETAQWIVDHRHTYVMPMLNPDGNHLNSRTNARLVNINRNYPVGWGALDEGFLGNNPGPYAASEPETQAVVAWVKAVQPDYFNSFHTGTDLMLYPVGYAEVAAKDDAVFRRICEEMGEADPEFCGPVYSTIYPASGIAVDTAYFETGAVAWTYEVSPEQGRYFSLEDPRLHLDRYWNGVMHAFLNVEKYGAHLELEALRLVDAGSGAYAVEATVRNTGYGNLTWADLTFALPGGEAAATRITSLGSGEAQALRVVLPRAGDAREGELGVTMSYPKRLETAPMAVPGLGVPVLRDAAGRLSAEVVPVSLGDLGEQRATPGLEGPAVLALAGAVAFAARRRA